MESLEDKKDSQRGGSLKQQVREEIWIVGGVSAHKSSLSSELRPPYSAWART